MKPLRLTLSAFGPFADEETIDFGNLKGKSFFLIHGPTGSGKTTLLDAMCYALYGKTSGNEREGRQMRSDHAEPTRLTEVTFDFALGTDRYRVCRSPDQERPRTRGQGTTTKPSRAVLWKRTECAEGEEGVPLAEQPTKVTEQVESLLGFKCEQFRQVIMLPQGQFRQLLMADSNQRQALLEVLFQGQYYRRVEEALKSEAATLRGAIEDARRKQASILSAAGVQTIEALTADVEDLRRQEQEWRARQTVLIERQTQAKAHLDHAEEVGRKFRELNDAVRALTDLEAQTSEQESRKSRLDRARKAEGLVEIETAYRRCAAELQDTVVARDKTTKALEKAQALARDHRETYEREKAREPEREQAAARVTELRAAFDRVASLEEASSALEIHRRNAAQVKIELDEAEARRQKFAAQREATQNTLETKAREAARLEERRMALEKAESLERDRTQLDRLRKDDEKASKHYEELKRDCEKAEADLAAARERARVLEKAWVEGQAAILAEQLVDGAPCPVCGALDHPSPAKDHGDIPREEDVNAQRYVLDTAEAWRQEAGKKLARQEQELVQLRTAMEGKQQALGEASRAPLKALKEAHAKAREEFEAAHHVAEELPRLEASLNALKKEESQAAAHSVEREQRLRVLQAEIAAAEAVVSERSAALPEALRSREALQAALHEALTHIVALRATLESAEALSKRSDEEVVRATADRENAVAASAAAEARKVEAEARFFKRLSEAGFADVSALGAAKLAGAEMDHLEEAIRSYETRCESARERHRRAVAATSGLVPLDEAAASETLRQVEAEIQTVVREHAQAVANLNRQQAFLEQVTSLQRETEKLDQEYEVVGRIAAVAGSDNRQRVSFQRFVLMAFLDHVLTVATKRLHIMSRGRFSLERRIERGDRRLSGGLDLQVCDAYTGTARAVATLSGGESFLASLSLALGLADVVQHYAGGMRLDTVFIDEGFGSLDPEALDLAIRALIDLQEAGRLVGIISHVPELKERIDARLEISSDRRGSRARFVLS